MKKKKKNTKKTEKLSNKSILLVFTRYLFAALLSLNNLYIFYLVFTPLTIYPLYFLLNLFFETSLFGRIITINNFRIVIVEACIAGAAYYLLTLLNLFIKMDVKKRIFSLFYSYFLFLVLNIIRLFIFSVLFVKSFSLFNFLHLLFWYVLSGVIVFLVWIATITKFKIKSTPIVDDFKPIIEGSFLKRKKIKNKSKKN